jgi:hypothetical protein
MCGMPYPVKIDARLEHKARTSRVGHFLRGSFAGLGDGLAIWRTMRSSASGSTPASLAASMKRRDCSSWDTGLRFRFMHPQRKAFLRLESVAKQCLNTRAKQAGGLVCSGPEDRAHPRCDRIELRNRTVGVRASRHQASRARRPIGRLSSCERGGSGVCLAAGSGVLPINASAPALSESLSRGRLRGRNLTRSSTPLQSWQSSCRWRPQDTNAIGGWYRGTSRKPFA